MPAYIIFTRENTTDQAQLDVYAEMAPASFPGHPITPRVVYGDFEMLEGTPIEGTVVLEFPTIGEAQSWYRSPKYQAAAAHRHAGAEYRVFIVNGVE